MNRVDQVSHTRTVGPACKGLYKAGALAALIAALLFRRNLDAEWLLLRGTGVINVGPLVSPNTVIDWFTLLQQNRLLGLTLLNLFDLVNYALVGLIFLALFFALRRASQLWMVIAAAFGFSGIIIYFASNQAFSMLSLSEQFADAATDVQRGMILAAGQALLAVHQNASFAGSGIYLSFLLVSVAGLIISAIMLRSGIFSKSTAYMGILANGFGLGYYIVIAFAPALVYVPLSVSAIFLLIWYLRIGSRLWSLASQRVAGSLQAPAYSRQDVSCKNNLSQPL